VKPYLVDRVSWPVFALAALLLVLTLVDGVITLLLLDRGFEEANPVLRFLLDRSTSAFFVAKYLLTALFLPRRPGDEQYRLFGTRFRVGHLIPIVAVLYLVLIVYQIVLWNTDETSLGEVAEDYQSIVGPALPARVWIGRQSRPYTLPRTCSN